MDSIADGWALVRGAVRDVRQDRRRVRHAFVVLLAVAIVFSVLRPVLLLLSVGLVLLLPFEADPGLVWQLQIFLGFALFAIADALLVAVIDGEHDTLRGGLGTVRANAGGVAVWTVAFVLAMWPLRALFGWPVRLAVAAWTDLSLALLLSPAILAPVATVAVLATASFYVLPLVVLEGAPPRTVVLGHLRLLRVAPIETAVAVGVGLAAVLGSLLLFPLAILALGISAVLVWAGIGVLILPLAVVGLVLWLVALSVSYALARSLLVRAYHVASERADVRGQGHVAQPTTSGAA